MSVKRLTPLVFFLAFACSFALYVRQESDTLYFGTSKPDGSVVTSAEWQQFVRDVVVPRFPGFTEWIAQGEWKGRAEETHVMVIVHGTGEETRIREIVEEYKRRFNQESVFRVREDVWIPEK